MDIHPPPGQETSPAIGFCWITPPFHDHNFEEVGFARAAEMGCSIEHRQMNWADLERIHRDPLSIDFGPLESWYRLCERYGMKKSISLCLVNSNTNAPSVPAGLEYESLNDSGLVEGFCNFLDAVMERFPDIDYVSFGNEINYHFEGRPDEVDEYVDFCRRVGMHFKSRHDAKVMTIFGFTGISESGRGMVKLFLPFSDLMGISSYDLSLHNMSQSQISSDRFADVIDGYVDLLDGKRFAIVEMAAFSSPGVGGSPGYQSRGVRNFFGLCERYRDRMDFACWFSLYDAAPGLLATFAPFLETFSSAGLLSPGGMPKPSYYEWEDQIQRFKSGVS